MATYPPPSPPTNGHSVSGSGSTPPLSPLTPAPSLGLPLEVFPALPAGSQPQPSRRTCVFLPWPGQRGVAHSEAGDIVAWSRRCSATMEGLLWAGPAWISSHMMDWTGAVWTEPVSKLQGQQDACFCCFCNSISDIRHLRLRTYMLCFFFFSRHVWTLTAELWMLALKRERNAITSEGDQQDTWYSSFRAASCFQ